MATKLENAADENSCWHRAEDHEQVFIFLGRDRHAPALIRLWAEMREREGEDPAIVNEARECAQLMEDEAVAKGKVVLSVSAVSAFAASLNPSTAVTEDEYPEQEVDPDPYKLKIGQIVVAGRGRPAKLVRIFGHEKEVPEAVRGMANIRVPGTNGPATVQFQTLRPALPEEVEAYRNSGGRM